MVAAVRNFTLKIGALQNVTLPSLNQVARNVSKVALPLVCFLALQAPQAADAGLGSYLACIALITASGGALTGGALIPSCANTAARLCLPLLFAPGP